MSLPSSARFIILCREGGGQDVPKKNLVESPPIQYFNYYFGASDFDSFPLTDSVIVLQIMQRLVMVNKLSKNMRL